MRVVRSLALRLSQILASTAAICFLLMALTMVLQQTFNYVTIYGVLVLLCIIWILFIQYVIKSVDQELITEVARILYPAGGILSLVLSVVLSLILQGQLVEPKGQQFVIIFAGVGVLLFLIVRCFDIKFLRSLEEIQHIDETDDEREE